jgi:hypothetical protein
MITNYHDARALLKSIYGQKFVFIARERQPTIGVRPVEEQLAGALTLAWQRVSPGAFGEIQIGHVLATGDIDWTWDIAQELEGRITDAECVTRQASRIRNLTSDNMLLLKTLQVWLEWGREHTGPTQPNSPHRILIETCNVIEKVTGRKP